MSQKLNFDNPMDWVAVRDTGCWDFQGEVKANGYGRLGRRGFAHRVFYERYVGPIPAGLQIDHLCRNKRCVNPNHLEVVTGKVNTRRSDNPMGINGRKTHCQGGHEFSDENTRWRDADSVNPWRECKACSRIWAARTAANRAGSEALVAHPTPERTEHD